MWGALNGIATFLALLPFSLEDEKNLSADSERKDKDHE